MSVGSALLVITSINKNKINLVCTYDSHTKWLVCIYQGWDEIERVHVPREEKKLAISCSSVIAIHCYISAMAMPLVFKCGMCLGPDPIAKGLECVKGAGTNSHVWK